ncbi:MAG: hypothetical protein QM730_17260 [Anaerolineales bacterium]
MAKPTPLPLGEGRVREKSCPFADKLGGGSVLFWGAIAYGLIDFVAGLIGWLSNR